MPKTHPRICIYQSQTRNSSSGPLLVTLGKWNTSPLLDNCHKIQWHSGKTPTPQPLENLFKGMKLRGQTNLSARWVNNKRRPLLRLQLWTLSRLRPPPPPRLPQQLLHRRHAHMQRKQQRSQWCNRQLNSLNNRWLNRQQNIQLIRLVADRYVCYVLDVWQ